jgi:hypothetical protein
VLSDLFSQQFECSAFGKNLSFMSLFEKE